MTAAELAAWVVREPGRGTRRLRRGIPEGFSQAFFTEVLRLFAVDHAALIPLGPAAELNAQKGDDLALAHRTLAIVHRAAGRWRKSADAFLAAGRLARSPVDRLTFQTGAIDALARAGEVNEAVRLGKRLQVGLRELGEEAFAARVALNLSYALMQQDRYEEALRYLVVIAETLERAGFSVDAASAHLAASTCHLFGGEVQTSRTEAECAVQRAESLELNQLADMARANVAYTDFLRGDADIAITALLELRDRQAEVPLERARCLEYLGDVYFAMNLWTEAADAYQEALAMGRVLQPLHRAHLRLGLGRALRANGAAEDSEKELKAARRQYAALGNRAWQAAAETELARSAVEAVSAAERALAAKSPRIALTAMVRGTELGASEWTLREAERVQSRLAIPSLAWRLAAERARRSSGAPRLNHFRRMFEAILADQARTSSFASRGAIMRDKTPALGQYLSELLSKPTPARVREALDVVRRSRSIALLDELLQAQRRELDVATLQGLRAELNAGETGGTTGARRSTGGRDLNRLQRRWTEETRVLVASTERTLPLTSERTAVVVQLEDRFEVLTGDRAQSWDMSPKQLDARLRWLNYDLLAPMVERDAPAEPALRGLEKLGRDLIGLLRDSDGVSPDGITWRIPWSACLAATGCETGTEIRLHPSFGGNVRYEAGPVLLWVAEHDDLPGARQEGHDFLDRFPDAQVCRSAAEARRSLTESGPRVLHVISHAHHRRRNPMLSSIDFVDGSIVAAEIARSRLSVDLVTLSGCDTGRVSDTNRMEPDGLVRAFLAAGAVNVIGSAWPLDDEAAVHFYREFFTGWIQGMDLPQALGCASHSVRQWREHPYFWASPLLYGGYRA